jgi:NADH-quinone oxidoreductase subunit G
VRFGQEIAGIMELGMIHRGEHAEITTIAGETIDSELSGNMIDLCPVGALTSKPFRYSARTWELSRRKSVSPHDSTGSNLIVQVKRDAVMRVLPLENEAVNECWLSDRDRFSYEALNSDERLTAPMIKQDGRWQAVDWTTALDVVARGLKQIVADDGPQAIGALAAPHRTVEELHLLGKLVRGLGSDNIDHRLRHADFGNVDPGKARWLGSAIAELSTLQRALVVGSFLRKDHPLLATRLRQAARRGAQIARLDAAGDDWLMPIASHLGAAPSRWAAMLAEIAAAVAAEQGVEPPSKTGDPGAAARAIAKSLLGGERKAVLLGNAALQHPHAGELLALASWIAERTGAKVGCLGEAANSVGAQLVGALPSADGLNAGRMLSRPLKAYLMFDVEPPFDVADPAAARKALHGASLVVAFTSFRDAAVEGADVLLPIAPFTETSGTFVNAEGRVQSFHGVVRPRGETRPAWKVLRVLGNLLGLPGFAYETSEEVRAEALPGDASGLAARLSNRPATRPPPSGATQPGIERIADVMIYGGDPLVRRAPSLQRTADARAPVATLPASLWQGLGLAAGDRVRLRQGEAEAVLPAQLDEAMPDDVVRVPAAHPDTAALGAMFGTLVVEKA